MSTARRELGDAVERAAQALMERAGLALVTRQFSTRHGEIDLVMRDGDTIVFTEVRYRAHQSYGGGAGSVDGFKQARLVKAAQGWIAEHPALAMVPMRFDVIAASGPPGQLAFDWIRDAFRA